MFLLTRPSRHQIEAYLAEHGAAGFSYPDVGSTRGTPPARYNIDHNRIVLGSGWSDFEHAKAAVRRWRMFDMPGLELISATTPIETGRSVAVLARHLGFYSLNLCRIVYVVDETMRFGFAYGTLHGQHIEIGEERFTVELHPDTGEVWYDILAFSRPGHILVNLGYPYARYRQKKFAAWSKKAMRRAVGLSQW